MFYYSSQIINITFNNWSPLKICLNRHVPIVLACKMVLIIPSYVYKLIGVLCLNILYN